MNTLPFALQLSVFHVNRDPTCNQTRLSGMKRSDRQEEEQYANLRTAYQAEWRNLSGYVRRWRLLLEQVQGDHTSVCEAEVATRLAEERYREARNALAEYMLARHSEFEKNRKYRGALSPVQHLPLCSLSCRWELGE